MDNPFRDPPCTARWSVVQFFQEVVALEVTGGIPPLATGTSRGILTFKGYSSGSSLASAMRFM